MQVEEMWLVMKKWHKAIISFVTSMTYVIKNWEIQKCSECKNSRDKYKLKEWPTNPKVVFVGERPSVRKGQKIEIKDGYKDKNYENPRSCSDNLFKEMREKYRLDGCYITDMVKCIGKAGSLNHEKAYKCPEKFLKWEIKAINPKLVVAMGEDAESRIRELDSNLEIIRIPHPSSTQRSKKNKKKFEEAFEELSKKVEEIGPRGV